MTQKGLGVLQEIVRSELLNVLAFVVIGGDRKLQDDKAEEIEQLCVGYKIPYGHRGCSVPETNYAVAVAWRWIIPNKESTKLIVLHDSLLPKYRGFAPLVNMLKNGETKIGVTALFATENYDEGDIIDQEQISISYPITIQNAIDRVTPLYAKLVQNIFKNIADGNLINGQPQVHSEATYSLWLSDDDYNIDWEQSAEYLERFINALGSPYSGAKTYASSQPFTILAARAVTDVVIENRTPGKIIFWNHNPIVVCGTGLLELVHVVPEITRQSIQFRTKFT